jgi:hypothetical protein
VSLKDLREQSKKTQNVPIYMKGGKNKSKADVDEFDEFDDLVVPKTKKPPVNKKGTFTSSRRGPPARTPAAAPAPTRGRGRGARGRPPKKGNYFFPYIFCRLLGIEVLSLFCRNFFFLKSICFACLQTLSSFDIEFSFS